MLYLDIPNTVPQELKKTYPLLEQTLSLIRIAHNGQTYNHLPYWHHPVRVMLRLDWKNVSSDDIYAALMHDLIEDTPVSEGDLRAFGYSKRTIDMVKAVTRNKDEETYKDFILRICGMRDSGIIRLKLSDLYENSNNVRFLPPEKRTVMVRYGKSIEDLLRTEDDITPLSLHALSSTLITGELNKEDVQKWIGETPQFL